MSASTAWAAIPISIDSPSFNKQAPGADAVPVQISWAGGAAISGFNMQFMAGDGDGPNADPTVVGVSLNGSIFQGIADLNPNNAGYPDWATGYDITLNSGTTSQAGVLVTIFLDITSVPAGAYSLMSDLFLDGQFVIGSEFVVNSVSEPATQSDPATLTVVVPEPATLGVLAGAALFAMRRRRA